MTFRSCFPGRWPFFALFFALLTSARITFSLNGIYYTLAPGESVMAPAKSSGNQLAIWECICSSSNCAWDNAYAPMLNVKYCIIISGTAGNLTLAVD